MQNSSGAGPRLHPCNIPGVLMYAQVFSQVGPYSAGLTALATHSNTYTIFSVRCRDRQAPRLLRWVFFLWPARALQLVRKGLLSPVKSMHICHPFHGTYCGRVPFGTLVPTFSLPPSAAQIPLLHGWPSKTGPPRAAFRCPLHPCLGSRAAVLQAQPRLCAWHCASVLRPCYIALYLYFCILLVTVLRSDTQNVKQTTTQVPNHGATMPGCTKLHVASQVDFGSGRPFQGPLGHPHGSFGRLDPLSPIDAAFQPLHTMPYLPVYLVTI